MMEVMTFYKPDDAEHWIALDPGGTTGWALWQGAKFMESGQIECGRMMETQLVGVRKICGMFMEYDAKFTVIEDFLLRGMPGTTDRVGLAPVHVTALLVGMLDGLGRSTRTALQLASVAKPVMTDARLKKKGMYVKGPHARDAVRHGMMYMRRAGMDA